MDPDTCLAEARAALAEMRAAERDQDTDLLASAADTLSERFGALDNWIAGGGYLPKAWQR